MAKSMVAKAQEANVSVAPPEGQFVLPAGLETATTDIVTRPTSTSTPFVHYSQTSSQELWAKLTAYNPQVGEGEPHLMLPDPYKPLRLDPFRFYLVSAKQYWGVVTREGDMLAAVGNAKDAEAIDKCDERIETVVIVDTPNGCVPANLGCISTKVGPINTATATLKIASTPEWGGISDDHKMTLQIADPRFRFLTSVRVVKKIGKKSKFPYYLASGSCKPVSAAEYQRLMAFFKDDELQKTFNAVATIFAQRVKNINDVIAATV